ncbi:hypothetical protein AX774_g2439 [Zancudomyces culisetae]|uniref:Uncharacterized protein n=1 Tax=Zancudomyces culisetae TaxID=1213189 RepID=A0A1R1PSY9_ZANCU|nr:hypothetical protein AX774_g2439 [Zancudomyces culisetae]|eukprot:OMH84039.1 hypothetical protein AX774_g2439 [Zancudomyces culisetae]
MSLYTKPTTVENSPINRIMYLPENTIENSSDLILPSFSSHITIANPAAAIITPCPKSPNITANKNGNVITANIPGLTSPYFGTPYELIRFWNPCVNLLVRRYVGGSITV